MPKVRRKAERGRSKKGKVDVQPVHQTAPRVAGRAPALSLLTFPPPVDLLHANRAIVQMVMASRPVTIHAGLVGTKIYYLALRGEGVNISTLAAGFYTTHNAAAHAKARLERMGGGAGSRADIYEIKWRKVIA